MARDFFNPRRKTPTTAQARLAVGLAAADPAWRGDGPTPINAGARPHPLFSNLTESEIELSLRMMRGCCDDD
jgi:hypothetical protein